ncbi:HEAT repeat domain-containing protein [bacterium]|nr:HEAT repeat domain-containing protein [bacterium]
MAALCLLVATAAIAAEAPSSATPTMEHRVRAILSGNLVLEASQRAAVKELVALGEAGGIAMARYLPSKVTTVTITLRDAYVDMKEKASPGLRLGLESADVRTRRTAMGFLAEIGSATDRDVFLSFLNDPDETLRVLAARGLVGAATLGDTEAQAALLAVLEATSPALRKWAALALGTWGDEGVIAPLSGRLSDPSWPVRWDAAHGLVGLCKRDHQGSVQAALTPLLSATEARTRALAAYVLGKGAIAEAQPALRAAAARETDPVALGYLAEALRWLDAAASTTDDALPPALREHPFVKWKSGRQVTEK